jgi:hypothetical protein
MDPSGILYRVENPGKIPEIAIGDFVPPLRWDDIDLREEKRRLLRRRRGKVS